MNKTLTAAIEKLFEKLYTELPKEDNTLKVITLCTKLSPELMSLVGLLKIKFYVIVQDEEAPRMYFFDRDMNVLYDFYAVE